jgi:hypothetical protein
LKAAETVKTFAKIDDDDHDDDSDDDDDASLILYPE